MPDGAIGSRCPERWPAPAGDRLDRRLARRRIDCARKRAADNRIRPAATRTIHRGRTGLCSSMRCIGQHRSRLPVDQQIVQPQLQRARPVADQRTPTTVHHMYQTIKQIYRTGIITESAPDTDEAVRTVTRRLGQEVLGRFAGALTIRHVDAGSCNGCELEINALEQSVLQPRRARHPLRREPASCRPAAGHGPGVAQHGDRADPHVRSDARTEAGRGDRRLRLHRRDLRRELREPRAGVERHSGRCRRARLSAGTVRDHPGHPDCDQLKGSGSNYS